MPKVKMDDRPGQVNPVVAETGMGKPPFMASDGGLIDRLRELEEITQSEFQHRSGTSVLLALNVCPEAFPRQRIFIVKVGMSP